jgi:hypothetical protein
MQRVDALKALEIYKRAGVQADQLSEFYEVCKGLDHARSFQFPTLEQPPQSFLSTMEEYVKDAPRAASSKTLYLKDVPEDEERPLPRIQPTPSSDIKEEVYEDASPRAEPLPESTPPPAPPVEPVGDLLVGVFLKRLPRGGFWDNCATILNWMQTNLDFFTFQL